MSGDLQTLKMSNVHVRPGSMSPPWTVANTDIEDRANEFFTAAIGVGVEDVKLAKVRPISKVQWKN